MSRMLLSLVLLTSLGGAVTIRAQEEKTPEETVVNTSVAKAPKEKCCFGACEINYRKELGVPLAYLTGLGVEIHEARKDADPVALAIAANALAVAEKVSGKTAEITSTDVMDDALKLAKLRSIPEELTALVELSNDEAVKTELSDMAAAAAEARTEAQAATEAGEIKKYIMDGIRVTNHSGECVTIYVNGMQLGEVHQGQARAFHYHSHDPHHHIEAYCHEGHLVGCREVNNHNHWVDWHIHR